MFHVKPFFPGSWAMERQDSGPSEHNDPGAGPATTGPSVPSTIAQHHSRGFPVVCSIPTEPQLAPPGPESEALC